jgi:hypothetical protein
LLLLTGCDAFYARYQMIQLRVSDPESGNGIGGATVSSFQYAYRTTNEIGDTTLPINTSLICGGLGPHPDPDADRLTGSQQTLDVWKADVEESMSVEMRRGATTSGNHFAVTIIQIGPPMRGFLMSPTDDHSKEVVRGGTP